MADKSVGELIAAQSVTPTDLFVLEQNGTAKKLTGQILENWLVSFADGHGGIQNIEKVKTSGLVDTYRITLADTTTFDFMVNNGKGINSVSKVSTSGLVDTYRIAFNDGTSSTFTVTNGEKGDKGDTAYIWIKYASQEPTVNSNSFGDVPDDWIGVYFGFSSTAPTDWRQYKWYRIKGEKGDTGDPATLVSSSITYQVGDSGTIIPSGDWSSSIPAVTPGRYLWTRQVLQFNSGGPITSYSVSRFGIDGSGAVSTVAGVAPDSGGNVPLTAENIKALPISGGIMEGPINMNGQPLSGLNAPTKDDEAANKGYVDQHTNPPLPGVIYPYSGANIPDGFLLCDGAAYSRTEYAELFAAIGTMYGEGDGSTTFNVPDLVERVPAGAGDNHAVGEMVGEETHTLTLGEMPAHNHSVGYNSSNDSGPDWIGAAGTSLSKTQNTDIRGGSQPHNIMQPTTFIRGYIIATGKGSGVSVQDIIAGVQALPLGIEYGGIGATNAADARKNLEITPENIGAEPVGALRMELLWENASPASDFPEQNIALDLRAYNMVIISVRFATATDGIAENQQISFIGKIGTTIQMSGIRWLRYEFFSRYATTAGTGIYFSPARYKSMGADNWSGTNQKDIVVPVTIYGIKGVST